MYIEPRKDLNFAREITRAQIAFTSDPLDEIGLTGRQDYFNKAYHSFFKVDVSELPKHLQGEVLMDPNKHFRKGMVKTVTDFNSAYFGKNWSEGRMHTPDEVQMMAAKIKGFGKNQKSTFLTKMVDLLEPLNISDDILTRYQYDALNNAYGDHKKLLRTLNKYKEMLGRGSFESRMGPVVKHAFDHQIMDLVERQRIAQDPDEFYRVFNKSEWHGKKKKKFIDAYDLDMWKYVADSPLADAGKNKFLKEKLKEGWSQEKIEWELGRLTREAPNQRAAVLHDFMVKASDFVQSDMYDRTSGLMIDKYIKAYRDTGGADSFIKTASDFVEGIKNRERIERRKAMRQDLDEQTWFDPNAKDGQEIKKILIGDDKVPAWQVKQQIDDDIRDFKDNNFTLKRKLNTAESDLVDALLMNSFYKGSPDKITKQLDKLAKDGSEAAKKIVKAINYESSGSYFSKVGVNSEMVGDKVVADYLKTFQGEFEKAALNDAGKVDADPILKNLDKEPPTVETEAGPTKVDIREKPNEGLRFSENLNMMDPAARSIATDLVNHMKFYHESIGNDINIIARGIVGKDWNAMDFEDMRVMNNYFNEMRTGGWFSNNWGKMKEGVPMVSKRHWMLFPRAVGEETMIKDFVVAKEQGFFKNYKGQDTPGTIGRPTNYIERSQFIIGKNSDFAQHKNATEEENLRRELRDETGYETIPEGEAIYNVAFIQRDAHISQRLKDNPDLGSNQKKQLLDSYNQTIESVKKASNWDIIKDKEFYIKTSKGTERLTGQQIADKIDNILTKHAIQKMKWIKGSHYDWNPVSEKYEAMGKDPLDKFYMKKGGKVQYWGESKIPRVNSNLLFKDLMQHLREGKEIPMDYGLDGMRNVLKSVMMENKMLNPEEINILSKVKAEDTKSYRPWEYNPHVIRDPKAAQDAIKKQIKLISEMQGPKWTAEKKNEEIQRLVVDYQRLSGDYLVQDVVDSQMFTDVFRNIAEGKRGKDNPILKMWDRNPKAGNQHSRTSHWPGWETSPDVWEGYQKNLIDTYYRQISQLMSRKLFNEFTDKYKDKWPEDLFTGWTNFYADYINGAMGYPNYIPQEWLKGDMAKVMNVKGTPYAWWADNRVADRVNKIAKSLGMEKGSAALPPELRKFDVHDIRNWSNMEAKYQMAALLAHPKSAIAIYMVVHFILLRVLG